MITSDGSTPDCIRQHLLRTRLDPRQAVLDRRPLVGYPVQPARRRAQGAPQATVRVAGRRPRGAARGADQGLRVLEGSVRDLHRRGAADAVGESLALDRDHRVRAAHRGRPHLLREGLLSRSRPVRPARLPTARHRDARDRPLRGRQVRVARQAVPGPAAPLRRGAGHAAALLPGRDPQLRRGPHRRGHLAQGSRGLARDPAHRADRLRPVRCDQVRRRRSRARPGRHPAEGRGPRGGGDGRRGAQGADHRPDGGAQGEPRRQWRPLRHRQAVRACGRGDQGRRSRRGRGRAQARPPRPRAAKPAAKSSRK